MKELLRSTTAYIRMREEAGTGDTAHTTLVLFPDEVYLRALLKECAKAFFGAEDGGRTAGLIDRESYADCMIVPAKGERLTAEGAAAIIDESLLRPLEGEKKLFVLDAFHQATPLVQNKLLKVLEEPPVGVWFLLGATAEHAVLPTVLSRAQKISVPPFSEEQLAEALRRGHVGEQGIPEAAAASGGIYSVAESLLSGGGEDFRLAESFLEGTDVEAICRAIGEKKRKTFFPAVKLVLRDLAFLAAGQERYAARRTPCMQRLARETPAGVFLAAVGFVTDAEREIQFNANPGQAAMALAVRIREEKARWQKLS